MTSSQKKIFDLRSFSDKNTIKKKKIKTNFGSEVVKYIN